jgi:hypothetical protein
MSAPETPPIANDAAGAHPLHRMVRQFADPGNRPGPYTVLTRDALHMVMDAYNDSVLWSEDREACEVAAACMNAQLPNSLI